jgi:hypothetical protein
MPPHGIDLNAFEGGNSETLNGGRRSMTDIANSRHHDDAECSCLHSDRVALTNDPQSNVTLF